MPALSNGLVGRFVPLMAVAAANWVNLPLMRQQEVKNGISIETADGEVVGESTAAAINAVSQVHQAYKFNSMPCMLLSVRLGCAMSYWNGYSWNDNTTAHHDTSRKSCTNC